MYRLTLYSLLTLCGFMPACAQDTILLPASGSGGIATSCHGVLMDDGGIHNYSDTSDGYIILAPGWSNAVSLYFEEFSFEQQFDVLRIYDGAGIGAPLIGEYTGTELQGQTVSASGPFMTIRQITDDIATYPGFRAVWSCALGTENEQLPEISVFPNPVKDVLYVTAKNEMLPEAEISDASGRVIIHAALPLPAGEILLTSLPPGLYFLTLRGTGKRPFFTRIIKQ